MDMCKAIHEAIRREIKEGREPTAIILSCQAYYPFINEVCAYSNTLPKDVTEFEGLPIFIIPEDRFSMPGKDLWIKIAVRP